MLRSVCCRFTGAEDENFLAANPSERSVVQINILDACSFDPQGL
jgi:hypothetical protein